MVTPEVQGAFTGGISAPMLESIGVKWALAGHSERRTINRETDEYINAQCVKLIEQKMNVVLCIGETLSEYEQNLVGPVCAIQLKKGLMGISKEDMKSVAIAYEPVWAIGTGKVAVSCLFTICLFMSLCKTILTNSFFKTFITYSVSYRTDS